MSAWQENWKDLPSLHDRHGKQKSAKPTPRMHQQMHVDRFICMKDCSSKDMDSFDCFKKFKCLVAEKYTDFRSIGLNM